MADPGEYMVTVYLSRRNLLTLLSKLDRKKAGEQTACAVIKSDTTHPVYPCSHPWIYIQAVEDEDYYTDRPPGEVHESDDPAAGEDGEG